MNRFKKASWLILVVGLVGVGVLYAVLMFLDAPEPELLNDTIKTAATWKNQA